MPFELRPSPGKGLGAFATRKIQTGDLILKERPLLVIRKPHEYITEADARSGFQKLPPREKHQFLSLLDNGARAFTSMKKALSENSFPVSTNPPAWGLLIVLSRFNHSCIPNCKVPELSAEQNQLQIYATRVIMPGEELTICYNPDFELRTTLDRHQQLRFKCDCKACQIGAPFQRVSDMRRALLRGLHYITHGKDMDGQRQVHARSILSDPGVKSAAEEFRIPLSTRFIATALMGYLLEEEGLLDHFMVERILPSMRSTAGTFKTRRNAKIAAIVMAQQTWLGKVCTAFRLYGKEDAADQEIAAALRGAREAGLL